MIQPIQSPTHPLAAWAPCAAISDGTMLLSAGLASIGKMPCSNPSIIHPRKPASSVICIALVTVDGAFSCMSLRPI